MNKPDKDIVYDGQKLADHTLLVRLHIQVPTMKRVDHAVSAETNSRYKARAGASKTSKQLLARHSLADVSSVVTKARGIHSAMTRPWEDDGARIIVLRKYQDYVTKMSLLKKDFEKAARDFVKLYPQMKAEAPALLGNMFNENDYPSASALKEKFSFDLETRDVQTAGDFRAKINDETTKAIVADIEKRTKDRLSRVMNENWLEVYKVVEAMSIRLKSYGNEYGSLRDAMIENIKEVAALLPDLNLTNDPALIDIQQRLVRELCAHSVEDLRKDVKARTAVAKSAKDIMKQVKDYLQ
jgi:hypothetical protein